METLLIMQESGLGIIGWFIIFAFIYLITNGRNNKKTVEENKRIVSGTQDNISLETTKTKIIVENREKNKDYSQGNLIKLANFLLFKNTKYSNYFGEGIRRMIVVLSLALPLLIGYSIDQDNYSEIEDFILYTIICYIAFHVIFQIGIWIKEGFVSQE